MTKQVSVRFLPDQAEGDSTAGACVIMTDVLRASSTIATALANGAREVIPQADIGDSRKMALKLGPESRIGGERDGQIIDGFDMGNSPFEYHPEAVKERSIVLCTTNGTWALEYCKGAKAILIGALVNLESIVEAASKFERVIVVCAGTNREVTGEDVLFAGGVSARICARNRGVRLDSNATTALALWRDVDRYADRGFSIFDFFNSCRGGRNLARLNYTADLEYCANVETVPVVPLLDEASWSIRLLGGKN